MTVGAVELYFPASGLVVLDYDGASAETKLVEWGITLPKPTLTTSSGRPGCRLEIYRVPNTASFRETAQAQLAIRGDEQSLVYGTHPKTRQSYQVLTWVPPEQMPELPYELTVYLSIKGYKKPRLS